MTKRIISEELQGDWMNDLGDTAADAVKYFQSLPPDAKLCINWHGYDSADGIITIEREETDEEYSYRLQYEREASEAALVKAEKKRLADQQNIDMTVANLQKQMEALLKVRPQ
jgi:hypothetical protein